MQTETYWQGSILGDPEPIIHPLAIIESRVIDTNTPVIVSYGGGKNSTALLLLLWKLGIRPDLILFADTGGELPETYNYIEMFSAWLQDHGLPEITVTRRAITQFKDIRKPYIYSRSRFEYVLKLSILTSWFSTPLIPYILWIWRITSLQFETLEQHALITQTLPSVAYGKKACSVQWKIEPQHKYVQKWLSDRGLTGKVQKLIGIHAGEKSRVLGNPNKLEDADYIYHYPLIQYKLDDLACVSLIAACGLPVPPKSSCFFCPNRKVKEVINLPPELRARGELIEAVALRSPNWKGEYSITPGLGRTFAWSSIDGLTELERAGLDYRKQSRNCGCID
jgi:hypothetical protein